MRILFPASTLVFALTFTTGTLTMACAEQLQSTGTAAPQQQGKAMHRHAPNAAHQTKRLSKRLGLSSDQSARLQPILAERDARLTALQADGTLAPGAMHKRRHAIKLETEGRINTLLTPEQQRLYSDARAAHHHRRGAEVPEPAA